jgi:hypothetical protein
MQRGFGAGCRGIRAALGKIAIRKSFLIDNADSRSTRVQNCVGVQSKSTFWGVRETRAQAQAKGEPAMTLTSRIVRQLCVLAGRIGLVAAVMMIAIGLICGDARAIPYQDLPLVDSTIDDDGTLLISWNGPVVVGMSAYLRSVFEKHASASRRIVLHLDSIGGDVEEGERAIAVLQELKATHWLVTVVMHGDICASMCVPIYLQGSARVAAPASLWLIHEVAILADDGKERLDRAETLRLFARYFLPAGVSARWLNSIFPVIDGVDLWLTGQDLITLDTGIITHPLTNTTPRVAWALLASGGHYRPRLAATA